MEWRFSDGTTVRLGGLVEGSGALAAKLRDELELLPYGRAREVRLGPEPASGERLVPSSPYHVDSWCRDWALWLGVTLVSAPALPPLHKPPAAGGAGRIY
jgi:hypothetical protein